MHKYLFLLCLQSAQYTFCILYTKLFFHLCATQASEYCWSHFFPICNFVSSFFILWSLSAPLYHFNTHNATKMCHTLYVTYTNIHAVHASTFAKSTVFFFFIFQFFCIFKLRVLSSVPIMCRDIW